MTRTCGHPGRAVPGLLLAGLAGCASSASYRTPGGPADFRALGITEDEVRQETEAFDRLVGEFEATWPDDLSTYGPPAPARARARAGKTLNLGLRF